MDVVGAVIKQNGKFLLGKRKQEDKFGGFWEFIGGKVEHGESFEDALKRELREEIDCDSKINNFIVSSVSQVSGLGQIALHTFQVTIYGEPKIIEHDELGWFSLQEMGNLSIMELDLPTYDILLKEDKYHG